MNGYECDGTEVKNGMFYSTQRSFDFLYKYQIINVYRTVSWHFIANMFFKTIFEEIRLFCERALLK